jgi:hypothetical protein
MGTSICNVIVATTRVVDTISCNSTYILDRPNMAQKVGQHQRVQDSATNNLYRPDLQCLFVFPKRDLAPDATLGTAMIARMPLAFAHNLLPVLPHPPL